MQRGELASFCQYVTAIRDVSGPATAGCWPSSLHGDILDVLSAVRLLLQVRAGICAARLQDTETAMEHFNALLAANPADFADLYLDVGDLLAETKRFDQVHKPSGAGTAISSSTLRMRHVLASLSKQVACRPVSICM